MSVTQAPGPPPAGEVAELLDRSDERDLHQSLRHADYHRGYLDGRQDQWSAGYAAAIGDVKAAEHEVADRLHVDRSPWHVCCGPCRRRRKGHRNGCTRCEDRTRATFSQPHPDDYQGRPV